MANSRTIGLVTTFVSGRFYEQIMSGIQAVARQNHVDLLVIHGTPEYVALTQIGQQRVDGWLVLTYLQGFDLLVQQGKPMVTISGYLPDQPFPAVLPDNSQGVEAVMQHLLAQGHRRIAFVGDTSIGDIQERYNCYRKMLEQNAIPYDPQIVIFTDNPLADRGAQAARQMLARKLSFTAVVCGNDLTAIGLMREFQAQGIRIPDDIAIVGFDDIPEAQVTNPPLSSVRQRADELGSTATRLLLAQIAGETVEPAIHSIPTNFIPRESSGSTLNQQISQWTSPDIATGLLWQVSLVKELVRVLLPALPPVPAPSPADVWLEVDKLVQILAQTIDGAAGQIFDRQFLPSIFSSPPFANANPEILVEMLRVLETAGRALAAGRPDEAQAGQRLIDLLDQFNIEIMRSYRRRQNSAQRTLSEILRSQYDISQTLLKSPPQQVTWLKETPLFSGCLGLWTPSGDGRPPIIGIAGCYQREGSSLLHAGASYTAPQFPPLDLLPSSPQTKDITTCLVLTVHSADHDWGMLAVSGTLISNDPWVEDYSVNTLEICCGFLGIALEQEVLQEALHRSSENEQVLADHVNVLSSPLISLANGVCLIPYERILEADQAPQAIAKALDNAYPGSQPDVLFDLSRVPSIEPGGIQQLAGISRILKLRGMRVAFVGSVPNLVGEDAGLTGIHILPSIEAALHHLHPES